MATYSQCNGANKNLATTTTSVFEVVSYLLHGENDAGITVTVSGFRHGLNVNTGAAPSSEKFNSLSSASSILAYSSGTVASLLHLSNNITQHSGWRANYRTRIVLQGDGSLKESMQGSGAVGETQNISWAESPIRYGRFTAGRRITNRGGFPFLGVDGNHRHEKTGGGAYQWTSRPHFENDLIFPDPSVWAPRGTVSQSDSWNILLFSSTSNTYILDGGTGAFLYAGNNAGLLVIEPAQTGAFPHAGNNAGLLVTAAAQTGAFLYAGNNAGLLVIEPAQTGAFNYTAGTAELTIPFRILAADTGAFSYTAGSAELIAPGQQPATEPPGGGRLVWLLPRRKRTIEKPSPRPKPKLKTYIFATGPQKYSYSAGTATFTRKFVSAASPPPPINIIGLGALLRHRVMASAGGLKCVVTPGRADFRYDSALSPEEILQLIANL